MRQRTLAGSVATVAALLGLGLPAVPASADATTLYVNNNQTANCSDTGAAAGTQAQPYCTIQAAADAAQPDQTVLITAGAYNERVKPTHSGTQGHPITFTRGPGVGDYQTLEVEIGDVRSVPGTPAAPGFNFDGVHDITLRGLRFLELPQSSVSITGSARITLDRNQFDGNSAATAPAVNLTGADSAVTVSRNHFWATSAPAWQSARVCTTPTSPRTKSALPSPPASRSTVRSGRW